jgi:hypothetical protein
MHIPNLFQFDHSPNLFGQIPSRSLLSAKIIYAAAPVPKHYIRSLFGNIVRDNYYRMADYFSKGLYRLWR